jgi:DNA-binding LacI/PurR family transcriptional regulator
MKSVTVRKIAAGLGVSIATVSRVLNENPGVHEETRRRVLDALRRNDYRPTWGAKRRVIAILLGENPELDPYQSDMLGALNKAASTSGCRLEIVSLRDLELLNERAIAGAISLLCGYPLERRWARTSALPLVRVNGAGLGNDNVRSVSADGFAASKLCVERLWRAGHRRIGFFSSASAELERGLFTRRYAGFLSEMKRRGVENPERLAAFGGEPTEIKRVLREGCAAGICVNGAYGPKFARTIQKLGLRIPEDFSLISWEYPGVSENLSPAHTACAPDYEGLAREALKTLLAMVEGRDAPKETLLPFKFIERESVAAPHSGTSVE